MKKFERLEEATTPNGTVLTLWRHDGAYLIRADGAELMSTRRHYSEDLLAELVCEPLRAKEGARVLIGGLGLGFTLKAALRSLGEDARVEVAEIVDEVIAWNQNPEYGLGHEALLDPRVKVHRGDVGGVLAAHPATYDAIMLDVDNGAEAMTSAGNERLYGRLGIRDAVRALTEGGKLAYWAAGEEKPFERALRGEGLTVETVEATAWEGGGPRHALYIARRASGGAQ